MTQITTLDVVDLNIKVLVQVTKCQQLLPIGVTPVPSTVKNQVKLKEKIFFKDFNTKKLMRVLKPETKYLSKSSEIQAWFIGYLSSVN